MKKEGRTAGIVHHEESRREQFLPGSGRRVRS
jgi:hypothetical protein